MTLAQQVSPQSRRLGRLTCATVALFLFASAASAMLASAAAAAPAWKVRSFHSPTHLAPGGTGVFILRNYNVGDTATAGPYQVTLTLPPEITATSITAPGGWTCNVATVSCSRTTSVRAGGAPSNVSIAVRVTVAPDAAGTLPTSVEASGGGAAAPATYSDPVTVSATPRGPGVAKFEGSVTDRNRQPFTQAGGHPFEASTTIELSSIIGHHGNPIPVEDSKNIHADIPPGFVGDPTATPRCTPAEFNQDGALPFTTQCPASTQVGVAWNTFGQTGGQTGVQTFGTGVFNLEPPPGVPAMFGLRIATHRVILIGGVRSDGDYGITVTASGINPAVGLLVSEFTFWGEPADPAHDHLRGSCMSPAAGPTGGLCPTEASRKPFLTNPMDCSAGALTTGLRAELWQAPGVFHTASFDHDVNGVPMAVDGCERVPFEPSIRVQPASTQPDSPTGLEVDLRLPQGDNPQGLATAHLEKAVVTLPEGMTVNPSSADGLAACSPAQIGLDSRADPTCPEASKIGSAEVDTPLLDETMMGSVYVAKQSDNPFGSLLAIYIVAKGPGVIVKLAGRVDPDPVTGRLTTTFDNNPQLPFSSFRLRFKGGPRAPLANPPTCGMKVVETSLTPYSAYPERPAARVADPGKIAHPSDTFTIDCPLGLGAFAPSFEAGTTNPTAGAFSPFAMRINRPDGQQYLRGLSLEMPPGLIANLRGVPLCPNAQANAGTCDPASKIGTAIVGAGAGPHPFFTAPEHGSVYLTEGYKGAPFGLASVVRAVAGPYDLGTVVVRQAILVDRTDAHITVVSDPIPTILEGIPLRIRSINVDVNRPNFVINPTSCGEKQIKATLTSIEGTVHQAVQRFQVSDCQALPLRPRFSMRLTGRRQMRAGGHPGLRTVLRQGPGQANMKKVAAKLPLSLALDPENAQSDALCEFEAGKRVECPPTSIIGSAVAHTPVLNRPLRGPVYFVKNVRIHPRTGRTIRTLPTLLIPLRGEVAIDVRANSDVIDQKLVSTFHTVPDAPVSRFVLTLKGGPKGILVATRNICARRRSHLTDMEVDGQNGKRADQAVRIRAACPKKRPARLRVGKTSWRGDRLAVSGRVAKAATRRVTVTARCGKTRVSRRVMPKRGRWTATLTLRGRCAAARGAQVTASYPGGPKVRRATAARRVVRRR